MKHAGAAALDRIEGMLAQLRALPGLKERSRGVFYRKSKAFLHFHEDGEDVYADVRFEGPDFERICVTGAEAQAALARRVGSWVQSS